MSVGRPKKSLLEHVQDRSFRARTHAQLLETSALLHSQTLRDLQRRYQRAKRADTRKRIALEFERALKPTAIASSKGSYDDVDDEGTPLEVILDELGPPHSAERVINFFPRFLKHFKGPKAGEAFELEDWQQAFVREAFKRKRGRRVYKIVYLIVPGGCGKSPLVAGFSLYALCEFTDAPELYCLAGIKRQAGKVQQFAQGFVKRGELSRYLRIRGKRIVRKDTDGEMEVLASSGANLEGDSPTVVSVDELHAFKDKVQEQSFVALVGKLHKRPEAYAIVISTAGRGEDSLLRRKIKEILAEAKVTRRGYLTIARDEENGVLLWMYAAPEKAPLKGKAGLDVIRRVTPASWVDPADVMQLLKLVGETEFRRLARNEWVASRNQWMQPGLWDGCRHKTRIWTPSNPERGWPAKDAEVILGFDGSYNNDATALVGCTRDRHLFVVDVWERPEDDPDWTVPRDLVDQAVDAAMMRWKVLRFAADPPGWRDEIEAWAQRYDDVFTTMFSTNQIKLMAEACREFYSDVSTKKLTHDGHPALARHLANAFTRESSDGAYIVKERRDSPNKIDAAVAAVIARYLAVREKPKKKAKLVAW